MCILARKYVTRGLVAILLYAHNVTKYVITRRYQSRACLPRSPTFSTTQPLSTSPYLCPSGVSWLTWYHFVCNNVLGPRLINIYLRFFFLFLCQKVLYITLKSCAKACLATLSRSKFMVREISMGHPVPWSSEWQKAILLQTHFVIGGHLSVD